jgi:hypothetical protein
MAYAPPEREDRLTPVRHFENRARRESLLRMSWLGNRDDFRNYLVHVA